MVSHLHRKKKKRKQINDGLRAVSWQVVPSMTSRLLPDSMARLQLVPTRRVTTRHRRTTQKRRSLTDQQALRRRLRHEVDVVGINCNCCRMLFSAVVRSRPETWSWSCLHQQQPNTNSNSNAAKPGLPLLRVHSFQLHPPLCLCLPVCHCLFSVIRIVK